MFQPEQIVESPGAPEAAEKFNPGEVIIEHVSNSSVDHPLIHLPKVFGIDLSVTKHVLMLWIVAAIVFLLVTVAVRRYLRQDRRIPSGFMNALEFIVLYMRDNVIEPNVGKKWVNTYAPLLLTFFLFILGANLIGIIPIFDVLSLLNHTLIHAPEDSFFARMLHGGVTATGNFNVTAGLATVTFLAIIVAGTRAHGFVQHWKNLVPHAPVWLYPLLIPLEILGMLVRPFALTARLAANMTGGHIAILAILSFVFIFFELFGQAAALGVGVILSVPVGVGLSGLELIVILVQAYVFTLLSAVFIGMAIHAHH
jgi:F-type H+-transporting ATPase subunit a